ncbi:unnamed protein product [Moneuplotes crassus]|uniref:Ubiquitin-like protease family profile domain-containing protein n=1 Tax=Euplotes crassus TaxID=5936 RepID=A0AAD2D165_EUPCR|nr:unnamed protein product [Moneuplotes crassus]
MMKTELNTQVKGNKEEDKQPNAEENGQNLQDLNVSVASFRILKTNRWVNDEIVNAMVTLLNEYKSPKRYYRKRKRSTDPLSSLTKGLKDILILNTYFCQAYFELKNTCRRKLFNKLDRYLYKQIVKKDKRVFKKIIVPIMYCSHWFCLHVDLTRGKIRIYDSLIEKMYSKSYEAAELLCFYLERSSVVLRIMTKILKINSEKQIENWFTEKRLNDVRDKGFKSCFQISFARCPQQDNTYDCGVFLCMNLFCIASRINEIDYITHSDYMRGCIGQTLLSKDLKTLQNFIKTPLSSIL